MRIFKRLDHNWFRKLIVDIVSSVLDGNDTASLEMTDDGDLLTAVAAERKQKGIEFFVVGFYVNYNVFLVWLRLFQVHFSVRPFKEDVLHESLQLASANRVLLYSFFGKSQGLLRIFLQFVYIYIWCVGKSNKKSQFAQTRGKNMNVRWDGTLWAFSSGNKG